MADDGRTIERTVRIAAAPEVVFDFLTDRKLIPHWMGFGAEVDPRPGGVFRCSVARRDLFVRGDFIEVERPRRVVLTWGWEGDDRLIPPGSSRVEFTLEAEGEDTLLHMRHSGLPAGHEGFHEMGWAYFSARLAEVAAGRDPGPERVPSQMAEVIAKLPPPQR